MLSFTAQLDNSNIVQLNWSATDQQDVTSYIIEHSSNGTDFYAIGSVNTVASGQYAFNAVTILSGTNFYRLKIIYKQGTYVYSGIIKINAGTGQNSIRPNPFTDKIILSLNSKVEEQAQVSIFDMAGKLMKRNSASLTKGFNQVILQDLSGLVKGVYVVTIQSVSGISITMQTE